MITWSKAERMPVDYFYVDCKNALSPSRLPELKYSLNPYSGCEHGCLYCYVKGFFKDKATAESWGSFVKAKQNVVTALARQIPFLSIGTIGVSTVTDPYQPLERKLCLTRHCIEILKSRGFPVSIQTKSALVLRDKDVITKEKFDLGITITTLNSSLASRLQPRASTPDALVNVIGEFAEKGVPTWIFLGPIIPEINDDLENIRGIIRVARKSNSRILYDRLNTKPWIMDSLRSFLENQRTELTERIQQLLKRGSTYWPRLAVEIERLCRDGGVKCEPAFPATQSHILLRNKNTLQR